MLYTYFCYRKDAEDLHRLQNEHNIEENNIEEVQAM